MKKFIIALSVMAITTSVMAEELFYRNTINGWYVLGNRQDKNLNASCYMEKVWNDGSSFMFVKDLVDGEVYIMLRNNQWEIADKPGNYSMRINFHYTNGTVSGGWATYELLNKNTMRIRGITANKFLRDFVGANKMVFVMPGTINNVEVSLQNSSVGVDLMFECIAISKTNTQTKTQTKSKALDL